MMDILLILLNAANVSLLILYCLRLLRQKTDSSLFWLLACLLYFQNIPLLFDSFAFLCCGVDQFSAILEKRNEYWERDYVDFYLRISIASLVFNLVLILIYRFVTRTTRQKIKFSELRPSDTNNLFLPYWVYIFFSLTGLLLFMYNTGISSIAYYGTNNYINVSGNKFTTLGQSLFLGIGSGGIIRGMFEKKYISVAIISIPILLVAYMTGARAQVIALVFSFIYYFIWSSEFKLKNLLLIIILGVLVVVILTSYRSGLYVYPITKDVSFSDLFFSFKHQNALCTHGEDLKRLILTGFYDYNAYDITYKIADYKFFTGWGSLHPTMLGWAVVDLGNFYWLLALYIGIFLGLCDILRNKLPQKYNLMFVPFIFIFSSVATRGSVQYAYSSIIYPFFVVCLYLIFHRRIKL